MLDRSVGLLDYFDIVNYFNFSLLRNVRVLYLGLFRDDIFFCRALPHDFSILQH